MKILMTNDDGIWAKGIHNLARELEKYYDLTIVAPHGERSACGHSITLNRPLIVKEIKLDNIKSKAYSVDGTPADCVKIAVEKLLDSKPDIIISGINRGLNLGTDVIYSGTVSAAVEGAICKIPSIAVSLEYTSSENRFEATSKYMIKILKIILKNKLKNDIVLNINFPDCEVDEFKGIKVCSLGNRIYDNYYIEEINENGEKGFKLNGWAKDTDVKDTDIYNLKMKYITITPLHYDLTNFKILSDIDKWFNIEK